MISSVMAKICLQTAIFHSSIEDAITNMTVISDQNYVGNGRIYRQWAVHGAVIRRVGREHGARCRQDSGFMLCVLFFQGGRWARQI